MKKAKEEYKKYQELTLSPVEQAYMDTIKDANKLAKNGMKKWAVFFGTCFKTTKVTKQRYKQDR